MDIQKPFTYQFEDPEWISKLGLGALIGLVPILNFAWIGYTVQIVRNVAAGEARPLPHWDDLEKKFTDGLLLGLANLIYMLPVILGFGIPWVLIVLGGLMSGNQDLRGFSDALAGLGGLFFVGFFCFMILYTLAWSFIYPAILVLYARQRTFAACFNFREITQLISRNSGPYLTVWGVSLLGALVISFAISLASSILNFIICIGWIAAVALTFFTSVYISSMTAHLAGQFSALAQAGAIHESPLQETD